MCKIFDSHAHYDDERFDGIRDGLFNELKSEVCGIINCGTDIESSAFAVKMAQSYSFLYAAVGYHPESINADTFFDEQKMLELINNKKAIAIGEIGLDYYWDTTYKNEQIKFFEQQIRFANTHNLPVIIHDREAHADTFHIVKKHSPKGVLHCYSGSSEMAKEYIKLGMYIGIGGVLTFKNSKKTVEVAHEIPLERILLETDAPYLSPEPNRGKTNRSDYIIFVAQKLAEIKNISTEQVIKTTTNNSKELFGIK